MKCLYHIFIRTRRSGGRMGSRGRRRPRRASRRTFSSRSCRGCPTSRSSTSSACPNNGSPSVLPPKFARGRRRPCLASSTSVPVGVSRICLGKILPSSTPISVSYAAAISISASNSAAPAFSFANAGDPAVLGNTVGILSQIQDPGNVSNGLRLRSLIMLSAILLLSSGLCCLL